MLLAAGHCVSPMTAKGSAGPASPHRATTDTFADDLHRLATSSCKLKDLSLVGFLGGGEVARYLGSTGPRAEQGRSAAFPPFLLKTADNPDGVESSVFDGILKAVAADRYAFFTELFNNSYNIDVLLGRRITQQAVHASWNVAAGASAVTSLVCVPTWHEDFRADLSPRLPFTARSICLCPFKSRGSGRPSW